MNRYRVIQWATGVVGSAALKGIIHHPQLDLVAVKVYDDAKVGLSTTGFHCVNGVPVVCEAPDPGIKTYLDLPMVTGRMGTHETPR